jgi:hypothetical protein
MLAGDENDEGLSTNRRHAIETYFIEASTITRSWLSSAQIWLAHLEGRQQSLPLYTLIFEDQRKGGCLSSVRSTRNICWRSLGPEPCM